MFKAFISKVLELVKGHLTVFKHAFKKPVTLEYPEIKPIIPEIFRGKHVFEMKNCIGCGTCAKVCPAGAICLEKNENGVHITVDYSKCIFCGNCQYYCPKNTIKLSKEFELATSDKNDLFIDVKSSNGGES